MHDIMKKLALRFQTTVFHSTFFRGLLSLRRLKCVAQLPYQFKRHMISVKVNLLFMNPINGISLNPWQYNG